MINGGTNYVQVLDNSNQSSSGFKTTTNPGSGNITLETPQAHMFEDFDGHDFEYQPILYTTIFQARMETEAIAGLISELNSVDADELCLYFCSEGGFMGMAHILVDYLNNNFSKIYLKPFHYVKSAGWIFVTEMAMLDKCEIELMGQVRGMDHLGWVDLNQYITKNTRSDERVVEARKYMKRYDKPRMKFNKEVLGYKKKELKKIESGDDFVFFNKRMNEFISNIKAYSEILNDGIK